MFNDQSGYLYAYNNPVRFTDFLGMNAQDEVKKEEDPKKQQTQQQETKTDPNDVPVTEGSDMDGWGNEAPAEEDSGNPYAMETKEKTDEEKNKLLEDADAYVEATKNTPEQKEIQEKNAASTQKMEDRFKKQENFVAGAKKVGEGTVIVVSTVAEGFVGIVTGLFFPQVIVNEHQKLENDLPDAI